MCFAIHAVNRMLLSNIWLHLPPTFRSSLGVIAGVCLAVAGAYAGLRGFGVAGMPHRHLSHKWGKTHGQADAPGIRTAWRVAAAACGVVFGLVLAFASLHGEGFHLHDLLRQQWSQGLFVAGLGLVLGMRHSTDADHVVAMSTIVSRQRSLRGAALLGGFWGLGHTLTILMVGSLIIVFRVVIPPRLGLAMEFCVALMLILLGVLNLTGVLQKLTVRFSFRGESAAGDVIGNANGSAGYRPFHFLRPLAIGLVHGLAGSAAVALLVLSTIHDPLWATLYLVIFGAGTMLGMVGMTAAMVVPLLYAGNRFSQLSRYLTLASGVVSLCFGVFLVYQLGYLGGLFSSHPHWTPE